MFNSVLVGSPSVNASLTPPSKSDCDAILSMLNSGDFYIRDLPKKNILESVQTIQSQVGQQLGVVTCHTVARYVADRNSGSGWQQIYGYLCKSSIDINFPNPDQFLIKTAPFFSTKSGRVITHLHHHSVISDGQGKYTECLPPDWYHVNEFVFIPHSSGRYGYSLDAL